MSDSSKWEIQLYIKYELDMCPKGMDDAPETELRSDGQEDQ